MANQNLSQFTELATGQDAADWTFIWDSDALISKKISRNNWLSTSASALTIAGANAATVSAQIKPERAALTTDSMTTITLSNTHAGTVLTTSNSGAVTINLPTSGTVSVGYNVMIIQGGAGVITIAANGNTRQSFGSVYSSAGLYAAVSIVCTATDVYNISGNLV